MDVDDAIVLTLAIWVVICTILVKTIDVYVTLLLIGLLVVAEVAGNFIKPETKQGLKPAIYFLLFVFLVIVVRKVMEVLS
ncbi:MAG TPA: hypothetical protein EYG86_08045 [Crocinitomicaceae bacterium]|nr:hypothetical protein [Crocinitomicaceae bacterium]